MATNGIVPPLTWSWYPSVLVGLGFITVGYMLLTGPLHKRFSTMVVPTKGRQAAFHLGTLAVFLALCSPLDTLGDEWLFSAHMVQHILLIFAAPPLWLLGLPDESVEWFLSLHPLRTLFSWLFSPIASLIIFVAVVWGWHLPSAYEAALNSETVHVVEHLMFIGAALIGWSPAILHDHLHRLSEPGRALYLFLLSLPLSGLATLITFAGRPLYPFYANQVRAWGLSPMADQQLGGLLMWVPGGLVFFFAIMWVLSKYLNQSENESEPLVKGDINTLEEKL